MHRHDIEIVTLRERPDLREEAFSAFQPPFWPEFLSHDPAAHLYFGAGHFEAYCDHALAAVENGVVVGRAFTVPFAFNVAGRDELPDGGWDAVIYWAHEDRAMGRPPNAVSALEVSLLPHVRGCGLSRVILEAMRRNTRKLGFRDLYVPVRPTEKAREPFKPMEDYVADTRRDGLQRDPWLRTHLDVGGEIAKIAPFAMTVKGTLAEWKTWTGLNFKGTDPVVVDGGLVPVRICADRDRGVYVEPGVWVRHSV
jgi:GNAT superfamily N-acetyltransferase